MKNVPTFKSSFQSQDNVLSHFHVKKPETNIRNLQNKQNKNLKQVKPPGLKSVLENFHSLLSICCTFFFQDRTVPR